MNPETYSLSTAPDLGCPGEWSPPENYHRSRTLALPPGAGGD